MADVGEVLSKRREQERGRRIAIAPKTPMNGTQKHLSLLALSLSCSLTSAPPHLLAFTHSLKVICFAKITQIVLFKHHLFETPIFQPLVIFVLFLKMSLI